LAERVFDHAATPSPAFKTDLTTSLSGFNLGDPRIVVAILSHGRHYSINLTESFFIKKSEHTHTLKKYYNLFLGVLSSPPLRGERFVMRGAMYDVSFL
jgi:hypothetical protein